MRKCLMLCPIFEPYAGGGGQYFPFLRTAILPKCDFSSVDVITEYHPKLPIISTDGTGTIYRILPRRDSKESKTLFYNIASFLLTYVIITVIILFLMWKKNYSDFVFTRYYRKKFYKFLAFIKGIFKVNIICDLRATTLNINSYKGLEVCDVIICNSLAVFDQARALISLKHKCTLVKNPINFSSPNKSFWNEFLELRMSYDISDGYLLFVGQLLERKSISEVIKAFDYLKKLHPELQLVIIGRNMLGRKILNEMNRVDAFYLGELNRQLVLWFMEKSELILQPSKIEGIPRVTLEALYLKKKVVMARCVPEFVSSDPSFVAFDLLQEPLADLILKSYRRSDTPKYDVLSHEVKEVILQYKHLFEGIN
jgi:glycosyltransferase involved in cell wall biosynthesis